MAGRCPVRSTVAANRGSPRAWLSGLTAAGAPVVKTGHNVQASLHCPRGSLVTICGAVCNRNHTLRDVFAYPVGVEADRWAQIHGLRRYDASRLPVVAEPPKGSDPGTAERE